MKYDEEETKDVNPKLYITIIFVLVSIIIILIGIIVVVATSNKKVDCSKECQEIQENMTTTKNKDDDKDNEDDEVDKDDEDNSELEIIIDTSYKITPNLPNIYITFASSSCTLIEDFYQKSSIDKTKTHSLTIRDIELNSNKHRYKYIVDITNNINIELFDNEYISTKDTSKYLLTKVCNYNNHFIVIENKSDEPVKALVKIIDINGEIKYYKDNIIDVTYEDELLYLAFANKDKYERISVDLKNKLVTEVIEEDDIDCDKIDATQVNLTAKEKDIIKYCELKTKSLN